MCEFEQLPEKLKRKINSLNLKVVSCTDFEHYSECFVQDSAIFGIYLYNKMTDEIKCQWIGRYAIEILHNALESTRP